MEPLYRPGAPACTILRYGWTAHPMRNTNFPAEMEVLCTAPREFWESDGLRLLEHRFSSQQIQMTFSVKPQVSPVFCTARAKGRLDHAMRKAGLRVQFSRNLAFTSIGENHRADVETYIEQQVDKESWADPRARELLREFTVVNPTVDLSGPTSTSSGRYWYNLHLVLVTESRWRNWPPTWLRKIRDQSRRIATAKGHGISRLSVMPDHLHIALRGNLNDSPETIALAFQNNLAYSLGQIPIWRWSYYASTFGEYDMNAVRNWDC